MKPMLTQEAHELYYYNDKDEKILGLHPNLKGECPELYGNCTYLLGNCTGLRGDCSGLWGNCIGLIGVCTGLLGNCSGSCGDLDQCEISDEDRENGVIIEELILKEK